MPGNGLGFHNQPPTSPRRAPAAAPVSTASIEVTSTTTTSSSRYHLSPTMWRPILSFLNLGAFVWFTLLAIGVGVWEDVHFHLKFVDPKLDTASFNASYCSCASGVNTSCTFDYASCASGQEHAVYGDEIDAGDLIRALLIAIASLSAAGCLVFTLHFRRDQHPLVDHAALPMRWFEMALTLSLTAIVTVNLAHLFDVYFCGMVGVAIFSFMFIGSAIEEHAAHGQIVRALQLVLPGLALYLSVWLPFLRSLINNVHPLICSEDWPSCGTLTCYGEDAHLLPLLNTLFAFFVLLPMVLVAKLLYLGGWYEWIDKDVPDMLLLPVRIVTTLPLALYGAVVGLVSLVYELPEDKFVASPSVEKRRFALYAGDLASFLFCFIIKTTLIGFFLFDLAELKMY